jgi:tyrosinase
MQDPENRLNAVPSSSGSANSEHSHRPTQNPKDATIDLEWLAPSIKLLEAHDPLGGNGGAFCYVYV